MQKRYLDDIVRALNLLECTGIETLRVGRSWHVTALRPGGARVYCQQVGEVEQLILELTRARVLAAQR